MRGKAFDSVALFWITRITPAYAGKSNHEFKPRRFDRDHPRLCGEKICDVTLQLAHLPLRITPAYAGKRRPDWYDLIVSRDHPRLCGEKSTC